MRNVASLGWLASLGGCILYSLQILQDSEPNMDLEVVPAQSWLWVLACQKSPTGVSWPACAVQTMASAVSVHLIEAGLAPGEDMYCQRHSSGCSTLRCQADARRTVCWCFQSFLRASTAITWWRATLPAMHFWGCRPQAHVLESPGLAITLLSRDLS